MCAGGLNSHYFLLIGNGHQPNSIPIMRIPYERRDEFIPQKRELIDPIAHVGSCSKTQMRSGGWKPLVASVWKPK